VRNIIATIFFFGFVFTTISQQENFNNCEVYNILGKELNIGQKKDFKISFFNKIGDNIVNDLAYIYPNIREKVLPSESYFKGWLEKVCPEIEMLKNDPQPYKSKYNGYNISRPIVFSKNHILILVSSYTKNDEALYRKIMGGIDILFSFKLKDGQWFLDEKKGLSQY